MALTRQLLKELGLEADVVSTIFKAHGDSIENEKEKAKAKVEELKEKEAKQLENLKEELAKKDEVINDIDAKFKEAEEKIANTGNDKVSKEEHEEALKVLKDALEAEKAKQDKELSEVKLNSKIEVALIKANAKNNKAVKALLDIDAIKEAPEKLDEVLAKVIEENDYLFGSAKEFDDKEDEKDKEDKEKAKKPSIVQPVKNDVITGETVDISKMTFRQLSDFAKNNPEKFKELTGK